MLRRPWGRVLLMAALAACSRGDRTPAPDSVGGGPQETAPAARASRGDWSTNLGDMLVVPADSQALIVYPDHAGADVVAGAPLVLLNSAGDTIVANASLQLDDTLQCGDAPVARVAAGTPPGWSVGLRGSTASPVRLDSIRALPAADSARIVVELARLASAVTAKSRSRFTGLPFAVIEARRFSVGASQALAAHLVRRLPQEAAPLEEHILLITERSPSDTALRTVFSQQSQGTEETAQYFDVVSVVRVGAVTLLILARDMSARTEYQVLERSGSGEWRIRWTRTVAC